MGVVGLILGLFGTVLTVVGMIREEVALSWTGTTVFVVGCSILLVAP